MEFRNPTKAFEYYYELISKSGEPCQDTLAIFNESFTIHEPLEKVITSSFRNFSISYAEREWTWYMIGKRDAWYIAESARLWKKMMDKNGNVWSNYGWWWKLNEQLEKIIKMLMNDTCTRRAVIVHYSPLMLDRFTKDTPCNLVLNFRIDNDGFLHLSVFARSIDLWFGFCNDQYQFSKLLELVGKRISKPVGTLHFFITNFHIYKRQL